jgi:hypothetical protein
VDRTKGDQGTTNGEGGRTKGDQGQPNPHHSPDHKCATHHAGMQSDCKKGLKESDIHTSAQNTGKYTEWCADNRAYTSQPKHQQRYAKLKNSTIAGCPRKIQAGGTTGSRSCPTLVTIEQMPTRAQHRLESQQAINLLTIREKTIYQPIFTPRALVGHAIVPVVNKFEHYANPMVCPVIGEMILSYKN